jgi:urease accessory protein
MQDERATSTSSAWHRAWLIGLLATLTSTSFGHTETGTASGFVSGFLHPIYGTDHLIAMVAVGLWGAQLGNPAIWLLPITFPVVMAIGGLLGIAGVPMPGVEIGIATSAVVLGAMVLFAVRPALWIAALIIAAFAIWHGHAHGTELPEAANPLSYGVGFVIATGLLHLAGILIGVLVRWPLGTWAVRISGGAIAAAGVYFLGLAIGALS